jgi:putative membrane protein
MYEWLKVAHIISVIAWMAGLLYLPRLMVYHSVSKKGSEQSETFKVMERRLLKAIMVPAMIATWLFGLGVAGMIDAWFDIWFLLKLVLVSAMTVFNLLAFGWVRDFANDQNARPQRFFRIVNEIPTLLMMVVVVLVVVKPF